MPRTRDELEAEIDRLNNLIEEVTTNPQPTYTVDGVTVRRTDYVRQLREQRKELKNELQTWPVEEITLGVQNG